MAHEIEFRDNAHSFFEVGAQQTAWHRLGTLLPNAPALDDAVKLIRADYVVEKKPVTYQNNGQTFTSANAFVNVRTDTGAELGAVGPLYQPVQNVDAFRQTIGPLLDRGILTLETGAVLKDGAKAFLLGRLNFDGFGPVAAEVFAKEGLLPYVGISTDHSGSRGNLLALTMIRWVCANTLGMDEVSAASAEKTGKGGERFASIAHFGDTKGKHEQAAEKLLGNLVMRAEAIATAYQLLRSVKLTTLQFNALALLPAIGTHPTRRDDFNPEAKLANHVVERYEERVKSITTLWSMGKGHTGDESAWEAYNGVVEAIDHNEKLFPSQSGVFRLGNLMHGELRSKKEKVLSRLSTFARDEISDDLEYMGELVTAK